jgi:hypothetical protein
MFNLCEHMMDCVMDHLKRSFRRLGKKRRVCWEDDLE